MQPCCAVSSNAHALSGFLQADQEVICHSYSKMFNSIGRNNTVIFEALAWHWPGISDTLAPNLGGELNIFRGRGPSALSAAYFRSVGFLLQFAAVNGMRHASPADYLH